ncbi:MAG: SHOCT domain-containing protein [Chloroflexota bacterium]
MMGGLEWGMGFGGWLWMILAVVLVVAVVWAVAAAIPGRDRTPIDDAAQILKARFARGEISKEEYEQARSLLGIH